MDEARQQEYIEIVQQLLQCEAGREDEVLAARSNLVDEGLVITLLVVARVMAEKNDPENASTIERLTDFATQLAQRLGLNLEPTAAELDSGLNFLMSVFQSIDESSGDPQVVYPLWRDNLSLLNERLIQILTTWVRNKFVEVDEDGKKSITMLIVEFANLLQQFPLGSRLVNIEIAIECYRLALEIRTRAAYPEDWAKTQNNLAIAYSDRIQGERAVNLEAAIECYRLALEIYTRATYPEDWAMIQNNLAIVYNNIQSNRLVNIEIAIECYRLVLEVYTRAAYPEDWAMTQHNLAIAYSDRIQGERAVNLEDAIACCQLALEVRTRTAYPKDWAMTQHSLAIAYSDRIQGERAVNLEDAIACCQLALEVRTRTAYPKDWAMTQHSLAIAYINRIRGERAVNLEDAIACCQLALEVFIRQAYPEDWARTQMKLGLAYGNRIQGERAVNLEQEIDCYQLALEVFIRQAYPGDWAMIQNNLAIAYSDRIQGERAGNLEAAIECYRLALDVCTSESYPEQWAMIQNNLATAYHARIRGEQAANLDESFFQASLKKIIDCYRLALEVYTHEAYPEQWAVTNENIAIFHADEGNNESAIQHYRLALEIFQPEALPLSALKANQGLGNIYFKRGDWQLALDAYDRAIIAVETSRSWAISEQSRQEILGNSISVYENTIQAYINLARIDKAITTSERARSRQLVDFISVPDLYANGEIPDAVKAYLAEYEDLERQIHAQQSFDIEQAKFDNLDNPNPSRQLAISQRNSRALTAVSEAVKALEARKQIVWRKIRALDPEIASKRQVTPIDLVTIQNSIDTPTTAILSFYTTDDDTHIFIITKDRAPQLHTCTGQGWQQLQVWLKASWLDPYVNQNSVWIEQIPQLLLEVSRRLQLDPLVSKLDGITELVIIPHRYLHQIPFAAIPILAGTKGEFLLGDKFTIRYTPSCQILKYCDDRPAIYHTQHGTIENADGTLPGAGYEGSYLASRFQVAAKYRRQGRKEATVSGFKALMKENITALHFASHAQSRLDNPIESVLTLAHGNITLATLLNSRYLHLYEVFLSCCETHLGDTTITDDILTLATGFLCAGARSVISTLWAVDDLATALFSIFYYENRYENYSRAESLRRAQVRLRNFTGEEFRLNYRDKLEQHLIAYVRANKADRHELTAQLDRGEIDKVTGDRDKVRLTTAYNNAMELIDSLDGHSQADKLFARPYYWAAFICQGLA